MSNAETVVREIVRLNGGDAYAPIFRHALRELTMPLYAARGANGALFGFHEPWMERRGDLRYLTDAARRRLGELRAREGSATGSPPDEPNGHL